MNHPPNTVPVVCPQCHAALSVPAASAGSTITCSDCLEEFVATPLTQTSSPNPLAEPQPTSPDADDDALKRLLNPNLDASPQDDNTIRLEDDLSEEIYPARKKHIIERDYEFTVVCVLCGTRLDVDDSQIGEKIKCPDCHNPVEVRTPPPERRRAPVHTDPDAAEDDDFGLASLQDSPPVPSPYHSIANDLVAKAESEAAQNMPTRSGPRRDPVLDSLQRAKEFVDESDQQERPELPTAPFRTGVLKFLLDPLAIARLIVLGLAFFVVLGAIQGGIVNAGGAPNEQFYSVLYFIFSTAIGGVYAIILAVSLVRILQDTANGKDSIENWPDVNFFDWLGEAIYLLSGLFIAVVPGCVVAKVLSWAGRADALFWLVAIGGSSAGIILLFPFALVSMLESGSPISPVSGTITRSLRLASGSWTVFTLLATLVVAGALCLGAVRILWPNSSAMNCIVAVLLVVTFALYFRLLGRLTWCCDEAVLAEDIRLEEAAEANDSGD